MSILFWGLSIYLLAFLIHLIVWRLYLPKRQAKTLLSIYLGLSFISITLLWLIFNSFKSFVFFPIFETSEYIHLLFFTGSLALATLLTYPAIEADSPTLVIMTKISDAGDGGLQLKSLRESINNDFLIIPRVKDLLTDKMAYLDDQKYHLTLKGIIMVRIFVFYRNLIGHPKGG